MVSASKNQGKMDLLPDRSAPIELAILSHLFATSSHSSFMKVSGSLLNLSRKDFPSSFNCGISKILYILNFMSKLNQEPLTSPSSLALVIVCLVTWRSLVFEGFNLADLPRVVSRDLLFDFSMMRVRDFWIGY